MFKDGLYWYALTVKIQGKDKDPLPSDYHDAIAALKLKQDFTVEEYTLEDDSKNRLHFHGVITSKKKIFIKMLNIKGASVCCKEIFWYDGWVTYINKDKPSEKLVDDPISFKLKDHF